MNNSLIADLPSLSPTHTSDRTRLFVSSTSRATATTMYALKPVFTVPADLQITCPMYKLKNLHEEPAATDLTASLSADPVS